jgi:hypothetical protein
MAKVIFLPFIYLLMIFVVAFVLVLIMIIPVDIKHGNKACNFFDLYLNRSTNNLDIDFSRP